LGFFLNTGFFGTLDIRSTFIRPVAQATASKAKSTKHHLNNELSKTKTAFITVTYVNKYNTDKV